MASLIICEGSTPAPSCKSCSVLIYVPPGRRGRKPHYCSEECRPKPDATRAVPVALSDIDCAACGTRFRPISSKQRNCTVACARAQSHLTRSANAAARNHRTCKRCGAGFQKVRGSLGLYCSGACTAAAARVYATKTEANRAYIERWKKRTGWQPKPRVEAEPKPKPPRQPPPLVQLCCAECQQVFTAPATRRRRKFCGPRCSKRARKRVERSAQRARLRCVRVETVNPISVFERDGWRCKLCGVSTPRRLRGSTEDRAPELDHIIPLAAGGEHSYRNTQCACRRCNGAKSSKPLGQLRLFG